MKFQWQFTDKAAIKKEMEKGIARMWPFCVDYPDSLNQIIEKFTACKVIALDLDGTLLNNKKQIFFQTKTFLKMLQALGVKIVLVTGRSLYGAIDYACETNSDLLSYDGMHWLIGEEERILTFMAPQDACAVTEVAKKHSLATVVASQDHRVAIEFDHRDIINAYESDLHLPSVRERIFLVDDLSSWIRNTGVEKILRLYFYDRRVNRQSFADELTSELRLRGVNLEGWNYYDSYFNFLPRDFASKGESLRRYCEENNAELSELVVVGDNNNDQTMFELGNGSIAVAVANAVPELKRLSLLTTVSQNSKGVAELMHLILLAKLQNWPVMLNSYLARRL